MYRLELTPYGAVSESFTEPGLFDCPQYTRPAEFRGWKVPEILLGGHHEQIRQWRRAAALEKTARLRPELLAREKIEAGE